MEAHRFWKVLDNIESYICRTLLALFVCCCSRRSCLGNSSITPFRGAKSWRPTCSSGSCFSAPVTRPRLGAHNRVTFQFKLLPKKCGADRGIRRSVLARFQRLFHLSQLRLRFQQDEPFWKSQTLGVPMKYFYMILPIAFTLMTIRIIQVNYFKLVKGVDMRDPEKAESRQDASEEGRPRWRSPASGRRPTRRGSEHGIRNNLV